MVTVVITPPAIGQQRVRFPNNSAGGADPYATLPTAPMGGMAPTPVQFPSVTLGQQIQPFDPYSGGPIAGQAPTLTLPSGPILAPQGAYPAPPGISYPMPNATSPTVPGPFYTTPIPLAPNVFAPPAASMPPTLPPVFNPNAGPLQSPTGPSSLSGPTPVFPNGLNWDQIDRNNLQRLFRDTGVVYSYILGNSKEPDRLQLHEFDLSTTLVLNRFAHSAEGLRVTPGFTFHFLDGPDGQNDADLPSKLYSAYIEGAWKPRLTPQFNADLAVRTGLYTDFHSITTHSIRITGRGLGVLQVTPQLAVKLGIEYLDRARVKLLPAGGVLWTPNPQTYFDIYFPRPKFSQYWTTVGNTEFWWHIAGEYGGGSWTFSRVDAPFLDLGERADYNDIRLIVGTEWSRLNRQWGFFEFGYVFDRELVYKLVPSESTALDDSIMLRAGIYF